MSIKFIVNHYRFRRGTAMPRLNLKIVGNPYIYSTHAIARESLCYPCIYFKISYVFKLQDKYNASFFLICLGVNNFNPIT